MPIINRVADFHEEMTSWRRALHAHPELGYEEHWTCLLYTSPSPRDAHESRMPSSA